MTGAPIKAEIAIDLLNQVDVRVGTIQAVEDVPGSDKLVKLTVSFGDHTRTILAGMKQERANPREIEGKQALFVVNLAPKKMRGITSEGMLFDIGYAAGAGRAGSTRAGWRAGGIGFSGIANVKLSLEVPSLNRAFIADRETAAP